MAAVPSIEFPFRGSDSVSYSGQTLPVSAQGNVPVEPVGNANLATGQISVGTTATLIIAARAGRNSVNVINHGSIDVFLGGPGVTASTGTLLAGTKGASQPMPTSGPVYGVTGSGTQTVSFAEFY